MKNLTTQEFCEKYPAGIMEGHFIMKFETMRDCYAALRLWLKVRGNGDE